MKLVLAVDAIFPPLTGIGRYALELAKQLPGQPEIEDLRLLGWGWIPDVDHLLGAGDAGNPEFSKSLMGELRRRVSRYKWAVRIYGALVPALQSHRLRPYGDYLYHSPNYFLPRHAGPSIATVHDLSIYRYPETHPAARVLYFEKEFRKTIDRASWLITDSEAIRHEVIEMFGWPAERITSVPLGVDASFHPRTREELIPVLATYGLSPGQYALCVSTLEPRKNIGRLLRAYEGLSADVRRAYPLVLAGGRGWHDKELMRALDRAERAGWARHLGYVPQDVLPLLYAGARATCFPSLYEGFGLPVLESMASGVPVMTSNGSSLPEVCGRAGWLIDPLDVDAMRDGLSAILCDGPWRDSARKEGLRLAAAATWSRCVRTTVAVYESAMGGRS